ncbi:MAG TPA: efflux RND transporter periplasmic adaptor subunit [Hyphomicrobiaceae bacterium]|nr:efflux RND transporter periplasmic adaptor subunit [Hyphomicrobiaceae bacterium]
MSLLSNRRLWAMGGLFAVVSLGATLLVKLPPAATSAESTAKAAFPAVRVSVAVVEPRVAMTWSDFSGRLEAVERVEVRSRVAGAVEAVHFREGALVKEGDPLVTIDPAPYAAEVARLQAQVTAAEARVTFTRTELQRGRQLLDTRIVSPRDVDQRTNAHREAEANLQAARAALQAAQLNLGYTEVRAPVAGRVGRLEITIGNLVAAGPSAPVLTTLVSIDPIYASFAADEAVVLRALKEIGADGVSSGRIAQIPVLMETASNGGEPVRGALQLIDNQVDPNTGTVRVRAVFANPDGRLIPGQFARLRMGATGAATVVAVDERAIGTDQSKKYVLVVDGDNRAAYREVSLGGMTDGLRIVTAGLKAGERIVVNGLQHVRPGALLAPEVVAMGDRGTVQR